MCSYCGLFNDAFNRSDYTGPNGRTMINKEMEKNRKEAVVAKFEALSRHFLAARQKR
jgi:hypothetical protein